MISDWICNFNFGFQIIPSSFFNGKSKQYYHRIVLMENYQNLANSSQGENEIKGLLIGIHNLTIQMSNTFQQAILRHEEQFIKTYRIKISELTKLFEELTKVLEDKFINNALTKRLQIIMKERDYFKYECLKLNVQFQTALNEQNSLNSQLVNISDQMKIYKHLLEDEKLRNKELEKNSEKFRTNFSNMAYKTLTETMHNVNPTVRDSEYAQLEKKNRKLEAVQTDLKEKNQQIRGLRAKISEMETIISDRQNAYFEKKELLEIFRSCVNCWKREVLTKERKNPSLSSSSILKLSKWNVQKVTTSSKKQLLRYLFTSPQFLIFLENLLFSPKVSVTFSQHLEPDEQFMVQNRIKLFDFMKKKRVI